MFQLRERIACRFFLSLVLIAVIPIGIMGLQAYILAEEALTDSAFRHVSTIAEDHARHLDTWLEERLDDMVVLSRLPALREAAQTCCHGRRSGLRPSEALSALLRETLATTQERSLSYERIAIVLPDGQRLASTHPPSNDFSAAQEAEIVERLRQSEEPVFGSLCRGADHQWHMQVGAAIRSREGAPLAFILAVLDVSKTIDPVMTDRIGLGETGETYLVNAEGKIISESRFLDRSETAGHPYDTPGIQAVVAGATGTALYTNYMGREVLGSYRWLPRYGWGILAEMGTDEILKPLKRIQGLGLLAALLVGAFCLVMAYAVSRRVARPIAEVAHAARRMAEGELEQRIAFTSRDEVGLLATSFNSMAQQVSQLVRSLHHKEASLKAAYDELVATQDQLVRSERMAAIGELVASIAHEMRSPLSSVKLNLQIIEMALGRDETLSEHCQIALDQSAQLERMLADLLNYSKPLVLQKAPVRVEALVARSLEPLEGELKEKQIAVATAFQPELPSLVVDADKVVQVLVNVLRNALEATPEGGRIDLRASGDRPGEVTIAVTDTGQGILARNLAHIFQPFFTTKKRGTGLGLSVVKKIMDAHRGGIAVASEKDRGTTIRLTLPIGEGDTR